MRPAPTPPVSLSRPNDSATITTLLAERAELRAENAGLRHEFIYAVDLIWRQGEAIGALRAERDHLTRMLNPPPQR